MFIKGKTILLTNYNIADYAGSEINCHTLANLFQQLGANVEVATLNYAFPIREEFEKSNIKVKNVFFDELDHTHYDLIWAHHSVVLNYVLFELDIQADKIIFSSLSPFEPFEAPPAYANHLSLCLANSVETFTQMVKEGVEENNLVVFPNYVTKDFYLEGPQEKHGELKNIALVSNHIPEEVLASVDALRVQGYNVDIYGAGYNQTLVTAELLLKYNAIISIGKTVQYGMALGIPVYCYDVHGGPGWLTEEILEEAANFNFSGRGFDHKSSDVIVSEIVSGYNIAIDSTDIFRQYIQKHCILENNVSTVLNRIENNHTTDCKHIILNYKSTQRWNKATVQLFRYNLWREMKILDMKENISKLEQICHEVSQCYKENSELKNKIIEDLQRRIDEAVQKHNLLAKKNEELESLKNESTKSLELKLQELSDSRAELQLKTQELSDSQAELQLKTQMFANKEKSLESEIIEFKNTIDRKNLELDQKEANTKYLQELVALKDQQIGEIYCSKAWRCILFYRHIKNGLIRRFRRLIAKLKRSNMHIHQNSQIPESCTEDNKTCNIDCPLVTVAIPVYDRTDVLIESIESILNQTYPNIEIIAVCDGSPEDTLAIIRSYEAQGKIKAFYYPDNSGNAVRGRNKAIREAHGVYFAFQDSDDVADPDRIKKSVEHMKKHNADVVYGGWRALVDGSREIDIKDGQEVFSPTCDYEMLKEICVPCQSTVMARTEVLRKVGGLKTNMRYREDHELWLRIAYCGYKFASIEEVLTNLRLHKGNLELTFKESDDKWFNLMHEEHKKIIPMKPKIAYLIPGCGISGGIAVVCQHLNRLRERGYDVLMISEVPDTEINWFPNQKVDIVTMDDAPDNLDILVATGWSTAHSAQNIPAKKKYYFVQSDETRFNPEGSEPYKKALETYSMDYQFITEAKWIKKWLMDDFGKNAYYVPNGIDPALMYCTEDRTKPLDRKVRVLLEGPIDIPYKAMKDAFEAINDLDCEVWCISSAGVPKPNWRCDKFFNKVPMEQMKYIYSNCDILLKMSRVEGFFGPPMEMMACGGTCVVGKVTGYDEYIVDGYNALTVDLGDVHAAHDAVKRLIEDSQLRNKLAQNGLKTASEWQWDSSIDTLEEIYSSYNN